MKLVVPAVHQQRIVRTSLRGWSVATTASMDLTAVVPDLMRGIAQEVGVDVSELKVILVGDEHQVDLKPFKTLQSQYDKVEWDYEMLDPHHNPELYIWDQKHGHGNVQANVRANNSGQLEGTAHENVGFRCKKGQKVNPNFAPSITMELHYHAFCALIILRFVLNRMFHCPSLIAPVNSQSPMT